MYQENQGQSGHQGTWALTDSKVCLVRTAFLGPKVTRALLATRDSQGPRGNEAYQD